MPESPDRNLPQGDAASVAPLVPPSSHDVESDIADEIGDHLSLAARDLQLAGHPTDEAQQLAENKFGNVAAIHRRLWWIQKGDEVMFRIGFAIVMVVVILAVAGLGIGGWQMSQTLDAVGETLATLKESQRSLTSLQVQDIRVPQITGSCYVGDRSRPAKNVELRVYDLPERQLVRRVVTDERGNFKSGYLPTGTYTVIAPLVGADNPVYSYSSSSATPETLLGAYQVQSGLIDVHPEKPPLPIEFDLEMIPVGEIAFELAGSLPIQFEYPSEHGGYTIEIKLALLVAHNVPSLPIRDPIMHAPGVKTETVGTFYHNPGRMDWLNARAPSNQRTLPNPKLLPAKEYKVGACVRAATSIGVGRYSYDFEPALHQLRSLDALVDVSVKAGQRAIVRVMPDDPSDEYRTAIAKYDELSHAQQTKSRNLEIRRGIDEAIDQLFRFRAVKLEVVGYAPMEPGAGKKGTHQ